MIAGTSRDKYVDPLSSDEDGDDNESIKKLQQKILVQPINTAKAALAQEKASIAVEKAAGAVEQFIEDYFA